MKFVDSNKVEIFGRRYSIGGVHDSAYLEKLARILDERMRQVAESTGTVDTLNVAILAALNVVDNQIKAQEEQQRVDSEMERNIMALSEQIDLTLAAE